VRVSPSFKGTPRVVPDIRVLHVPTDEQYTDIMTKGLTTRTFEAFRASLCVHAMTLPTTGVIECKYTPVDLN
jgi:hypothetical protein